MLSCLLLFSLQDFLADLGVFCLPTERLEGDLLTAEMVRLARSLVFLWRKVLVLVSSWLSSDRSSVSVSLEPLWSK